MSHLCEACGHSAIAHEPRCEILCHDPDYGTYKCPCPIFVKDPDDQPFE